MTSPAHAIEEIRIRATTSDDVEIAGTLRRVDAAEELVILFHGYSSGQGNATNRGMFAPIAARGMNSLAFDFRGCGSSTGVLAESTISTGVLDAKAVLARTLEILGREPLAYRLVGSSYGGAVAVALAQELPTRSIGLKAPLLDVEAAQRARRSAEEMDRWERLGYLPTETSQGVVDISWEYVSNSREYDLFSPDRLCVPETPVEIAHGTDDQTVPYSQSVEFASRSPDVRNLTAIPGAGHRFDDRENEMVLRALISSLG